MSEAEQVRGTGDDPALSARESESKERRLNVRSSRTREGKILTSRRKLNCITENTTDSSNTETSNTSKSFNVHAEYGRKF